MRNNILVISIISGAFLIIFALLIGLVVPDEDRCNYTEDSYLGKSKKECFTIQFSCAPGYEPFSDDCGCGCKKILDINNTDLNVCSPESRDNDFCIEWYQPVCGWFDPEQIQCIRYPCANTYSNSCHACRDDKVKYWSSGECPD